MENIFSDDDDEYEALRDQLYEGEADEEEKLVPMFGLYTLVKTTNKEKPREDLFLRALEPPSSNDLDPYKDCVFQHKKPVFVKPSACDNFSFFGMNQNKVKMESSTFSLENHIAERAKLLEKMRKTEEEEAEHSDSNDKENDRTKSRTPSRKPKFKKVDTPIPALRKRSRKIALSSDEDSDSDENYPIRSPRKKRVSPSND